MYGYPVTIPMQVPPPERAKIPLPELKELPVIEDTSIAGIRLQGRTPKALPSMPAFDSGTDARARAAEQLANEMRVAYSVTKEYNKRSAARAKANNRIQEKRARDFGKR